MNEETPPRAGGAGPVCHRSFALGRAFLCPSASIYIYLKQYSILSVIVFRAGTRARARGAGADLGALVGADLCTTDRADARTERERRQTHDARTGAHTGTRRRARCARSAPGPARVAAPPLCVYLPSAAGCARAVKK